MLFNRKRLKKPQKGYLERAVRYQDTFLLEGWLERGGLSLPPKLKVGRPFVPIANSVFAYSRGDVCAHLGSKSAQQHGFLVLAECGPTNADVLEVISDNYRATIEFDYVTSWHDFLLAVICSIDRASCNNKSDIYDFPLAWISVFEACNKKMAAQEKDRSISFSSRTSSDRLLDASVIFVQCGPLPIMPFIYSQIAKCQSRCELIVANNSPSCRAETLALLTEAGELFGLEWSYIEFAKNIGFGPACNIAADQARSELLLFHNNDVICSEPSDYEKMFSLARPGKFIAGAKQYFPQGDVMHDGIRVGVLDPQMSNGHPGLLSGFSLGRGIPPAHLFGPILCSGSLLCVTRKKFLAVDGFSPSYLFGHFEDIDLCLRLSSKGMETRIVDTHFLHCEGCGSALPSFLIQTVPFINRKIFTYKWAGRIADNDPES